MNKIIISKSNNPYLNLSYEESLLDSLKPGEVYFFLWQNAHTVVIGKHQNPWAEIYTEKFKDDSGTLARRMTGGGAVYQDMGNLNFTLVLAKSEIDLEKQLSVIIGALASLGIKAEFSGRNDILIDGRKFSGNAFYKGKTNYIHHGTIMYDVDLSKLGLYLNVSEKKLKSKGVKSVESRVVNLLQIKKDLTIDQLKQALCDSFERVYGSASREEIDPSNLSEEAGELFKHYSSSDWIYGRTPEFDHESGERFPWGEIKIYLSVANGVISKNKIYSDAMEGAFIEALSEILDGTTFNREAIGAKLDQLRGGEFAHEMIDDVNTLFKF